MFLFIVCNLFCIFIFKNSSVWTSNNPSLYYIHIKLVIYMYPTYFNSDNISRFQKQISEIKYFINLMSLSGFIDTNIRFAYFIVMITIYGIITPFCLYWLIRYIKIYKKEQCCVQRHSIIIDIALFTQMIIIMFTFINENIFKSKYV